MKTIAAISLITVLVLSMLIATTITNNVDAKLSKSAKKASNKIEKKIESTLEKHVKDDYRKYCTVQVTTSAEQTPTTLYDKNCQVPTNQPPIPRINTQTSAETNQTIRVDGASSSDDGSISSYAWTGQDKEENNIVFQDSTQALTQFQFPNSSEVRVTLTIVDDKGSSASVSITIINQNTVPEPCPDGTHREGNQCVPNPEPEPISCPVSKDSDIIRVGSFADTDNNKGTETLLQALKDCNTDLLIINGDLWYEAKGGCDGWISTISGFGWNKDNTRVSRGNHDGSFTCILDWLGETKTWNTKTFSNGLIEVISIDANTGFGCASSSSSQFNDIKKFSQQSQAVWTLATVHQPFWTVDSNHGPNGQASCYLPVFEQYADVVLEGHNHNYQRFNFNGFVTLVVGTGYHDTGSGLYGINSNEDQAGHPLLKGFDTKNGVVLMDLKKDGSDSKAYFMDNQKKILDTFVIQN